MLNAALRPSNVYLQLAPVSHPLPGRRGWGSPLLQPPALGGGAGPCPCPVPGAGSGSADCQGTAGRAEIPVGGTNPPWSWAMGQRPRGDSGPSAPRHPMLLQDIAVLEGMETPNSPVASPRDTAENCRVETCHAVQLSLRAACWCWPCSTGTRGAGTEVSPRHPTASLVSPGSAE